MKYRKKPVVIEAVQFTASDPEAAIRFTGYHAKMMDDNANKILLIVPTLEGDHRADVGDWIIRGVKGEYYPCKPDIFAMTYEPVDQA